MIDRHQLHEIVEELPPSELDAALRYLKYLWYESQEEEQIKRRQNLTRQEPKASSPSRWTRSSAATACNANGTVASGRHTGFR